MALFTRIESVDLPATAVEGKGFSVTMQTDGEIPFAQCIVRHEDGREWIVRDEYVEAAGEGRYTFNIPPRAYHAGTAYLQVEGCRKLDLLKAGAKDWETVYCEIEVRPADGAPAADEALIGAPSAEVSGADAEDASADDDEDEEEGESDGEPAGADAPPPADLPDTAVRVGATNTPVLYFGIHKHMHQPYYDAVDPEAWDGEKDEIFATRAGPYTRFLPAAVRQYAEGGLPHAGLSTSWSGSLIEQLDRAERTGRCGGAFAGWARELREAATLTTALGHPRMDFTAFGFFHPVLPLIPDRDIVGQIERHRHIVRDTFGVEAGNILFPPETAFHPHILPALRQAGVEAVIYDSIHHYRATQGYPYAGPEEGMLPPNPADQENFPVDDWLALDGVWSPSKVSVELLKPCLLAYTDAEGVRHTLPGIPAERYLGNEDARGGYGALQYEAVLGQLYDRIIETGSFDPDHPPFFLLHSDGDNHGGGAESYYTHNTAGLVRMCQTDPRFQLIGMRDYLQRFPVDPANVVHLEPGSWSGADNGDPQFTKWFSLAEADYSPDLNSWAVLTAFQNVVHTLEDAGAETDLVEALKRLLYTAETSCHWYWTGQAGLDRQPTAAVNRVMALA